MELTFGEQIKIILKRKNMTIRQLAELVEVQTGKPMSRQNLTQKLNRDNFQEQDMKEVAQALGCVVKISVIDPAEASAQNAVIPQTAEAVRERRPAEAGRQEAAEKGKPEKRRSAGRLRTGRHSVHGPEAPAQEDGREETAGRLAREEAAVTRQPVSEGQEVYPAPGNTASEDDVDAGVLKEIEMALMESIQKELYPEDREKPGTGEVQEEDALAWARQKPLVWPTLTVPAMVAGRGGRALPSADGERQDGGGSLSEAEELPAGGGSEEARAGGPEAEMPAEGGEQEKARAGEPEGGALSEAEALPFEEELFSDPEDLEDISLQEETEDLEDLEFFDLQDFYGEKISQVSAPYVMKRETAQEDSGPGEKEASFKKEMPFKKERWGRKEGRMKEMAAPESETGGLDRIPEGGGDVSFASAPYVIPREPEPAGIETIIKEETAAEQPDRSPLFGSGAEKDVSPAPEEGTQEEAEEELAPMPRIPGSFSGSRGDISSVSAPYVIPREPEEAPPSKPMGEAGYWQEAEEEETAGRPMLPPQESAEEPEEEEEPLSPDLEEKIASWDAAVKRRLENPFLRALEGRARRGGKRAEPERNGRQAGAGRTEPKLKIVPEAAAGGEPRPAGRTDPQNRAEEADGLPGRAQAEALAERQEDGREDADTQVRPAKRRQEEPLDLQGPALDPVTGKEYETNTVKHHPTQPDMLLVYDQDEHRWIVQAERAFLNFQINKRALLGKDYEPPVYLD